MSSTHLRMEKLANISAVPILSIKHAEKGVKRTSQTTTPSPATIPTVGIPHTYAAASVNASHVVTRKEGTQQSCDQALRGRYDASLGGDAGPVAVEDHFNDSCRAVPVSFTQHQNSDTCECPMCKLTLYISYIYRDQRRASPHVMVARPSPNYALSPDGSLPRLPQLSQPSGISVCPVYASFGFCPYHVGCFLPHNINTCALPRVPRLATAADEVDRLIARGTELQYSDVWRCAVCGYDKIDECCLMALGTEHRFRQCPCCTFMCYFPYVTYLVEDILRSVGDDYQLYKTEVDRFRRRLPDLFKIPLTFEAHRVASIVFAWTLASPAHLCDAMNTVVREFDSVESVISIGSGSGYIEHVLNRVMHEVPLHESWEVDRSQFPSTSFDNVYCDFYGERVLPIFAFDALALRGMYSVHVSMGGPISLYSLRCERSVLLLCWPPFGSREREESSMGFEALEYFTRAGGTMVIYIGDTAATGDWRFHMLLESHYKLVRDYPVRREVRRWCPEEMGFVYGGNDTIGVYRLRTTPLTASTS